MTRAPFPALPNAGALHQQALALYGAGDRLQAETLWRVATNADPNHADSVFMLGVLALESGNPESALANFGHALALRPRNASYHDTSGDALEALGRMPEAMEAWRTAIRLDPKLQAPLVSLGAALTAAGDAEEAAKLHRRALALDPHSPAALNGLGLALLKLRDHSRAEAALRAAVREAPDAASIHSNLGSLLRETNRIAEADVALETAIRLAPGTPPILYNLALNRLAAMRLADAETVLREALLADPGYAEAHHTLGSLLLATGRFEEGWEHYEWRRQASGVPPRVPGPNWNGEDLAGRTLLVVADEGFGDFINFCRFVPLAARQGKVVLEVPNPLLRLALGLPGVHQVVPQGRALPDHDLVCSVTSLWRAFRATQGHMPAGVPYLSADRHDVAAWQARLAGLSGLKVGLVWAGNPGQLVDPIRSVPPALLAALASVPGISFVSLQKDRPADPIPGLTLHDWTGELLDFADTAALTVSLDLIIAADTAVAHLAGALGRPVWLLNRWDGQTDPRWAMGRQDSYWYPAMRIFRQRSIGDWQPVIADVCVALQEMVNA